MRRAIYEAEVGDDVYGEDPTIARLETTVADLLGKASAVYVPSGTMSNQLGLLVHTSRATEVIMERQCHVLNHEGAAGSWLSGIQTNPLDGKRGILTRSDIEPYLRPGHYGEPKTSLIWLENTHNLAGGIVQPFGVLEEISALAKERNLPMHLDGARLWNASAASGIPEHKYASLFDTVSVCLSKGLGAPVGSVLVGSSEAIQKAREYRSRLGGSMRQAGILAAAGLYALEHHRSRLHEDHLRAKELATYLAETNWFTVDPDEIETNIVFFKVKNQAANQAVEMLKTENILVSATAPDTIRAVTHLEISDEALRFAKKVISKLFGESVSV